MEFQVLPSKQRVLIKCQVCGKKHSTIDNDSIFVCKDCDQNYEYLKKLSNPNGLNVRFDTKFDYDTDIPVASQIIRYERIRTKVDKSKWITDGG